MYGQKLWNHIIITMDFPKHITMESCMSLHTTASLTLSPRLMSHAFLSLCQLVNSELVAKNCKSRCEELGIPYFRLSPKLNTVREPLKTYVKLAILF